VTTCHPPRPPRRRGRRRHRDPRHRRIRLHERMGRGDTRARLGRRAQRSPGHRRHRRPSPRAPRRPHVTHRSPLGDMTAALRYWNLDAPTLQPGAP
jgi:hypothetical protein